MLGIFKKFKQSSCTQEQAVSVPSQEEMDEWMREGFGFHQVGNLTEAERRYTRILEHRTNDADALFLLGKIRWQQGMRPAALALTRQAIAANPSVPHFHHQLGVLLLEQKAWADAAASLRKAIELDHGFSEAHNDLGTVLKNQGDTSTAERHFRRAIEISPHLPQPHYNLALKLLNDGRSDEAEVHLKKVIELVPGHTDSLLLLGDLARKAGHYDEARHYLQTVLDTQPDNVQALMGMGACLYAQDRFIEASMLYFEAVRLQPNSAQANYSLGLCYLKREKWVDAETYLQTAINLQGDYWDAYANLGYVLFQQKRVEQAAALFRSIIDRAPRHPQLYLNYAYALGALGDYESAIRIQEAALGSPDHDAEAFSNLSYYYGELDDMEQARTWAEKAIAAKPGSIDGHNNLAHALRCLGEVDQSLAMYERAIELDPQSPDAHWGRALLLLSLGRFKEGWEEYEWRWRMKSIAPGEKPPGPEWQGEDIRDKTLLLYQEQGLGDMIHFVRYVPLLKERCKSIILAMPRPLKRLFEGIPSVSAVVSEGETPPYDLALPLMSLPRIFGTTLETIPAKVPYLSVPEDVLLQWEKKFSAAPPGFRVGLVWAGGAAFKGNRQRSMSLDAFAPLAQIPHVALFSLQKGPPAEQLKTPPPAMHVIDWTEDIRDFADTAACISHLDLVIAVDTAVAHLAGALGKPVWTLIPMSSDFRWLLDREDSPWYPTMRLFRQKTRGDWGEVIQRVAGELQRLTQVIQ